MKKLFTSLLFLFAFQFLLFSQEKVRTVQWNGENYFVYPYTFSKEYVYNYNYESMPGASDSENELVPYPGELPDGNYIIYDAPISRYKKKMWFFKKRGNYYWDTTQVAATFTLKSNKKEGEAIFYDGVDYAVEKGKYVNNEKEGIWMRRTHKDIGSHSMDLGLRFEKYRNNYGLVLETIEYKNGIREGKYRAFINKNDRYFDLISSDTTNMKLVGRGYYHLNKIYGNWKFYYSNGQLSSQYSLVDSIGEPIIKEYKDYSYNYGKKMAYYNGWHEVYYPNGQLLTRKLYKFGKTALRDTVYYFDGKISCNYTVKEEMENDSIQIIENYFSYDSLGNLVLHNLMKNGNRIFSRNYNEEKYLCSESLDLDYYKIKNPDTLVPISIYYDCYKDSNKTRINEISYKHPETGTVLKRSFEYSNSTYFDEMDDFEFTSDTASKIYYITEINYKGKNKEIEIRTYKHLFRGPFYFYNNSYSTEIDSVVFIVNNKRFNGKYKEFFVTKRKRTNKIKIKEDEIKMFSYYYGGRSFGGNVTFGYSSKRLVIDSRYSRRRFNFRKKVLSSYSGFYVNGLEQGEWVDRENRRGRINEVSHFNKGQLHGELRRYDFEQADKWSTCIDIVDPMITKKKGLFRKGRYFLSELENYENGEYHGINLEYYCNGRISTKREYQNGRLEGAYESFHENGDPSKKTYYKNGFYDGKYLEWSPNKKERYNINFEEGIMVGEYRYNHFNGSPSYIGNVSNGYKIGDWFTYFEDGNIKFKDSYTIEDSTFYKFGNYYEDNVTRSPKNSPHNDNSCYSKQYYPSGQLAAEGRIKRVSRLGIWKFYDEGGNLIRHINYEPGFLPKAKNDKDSIFHFGYYESWYANGQKQSEAYVLKEISKFDCYQEVNISMQDLYYLNYWDNENNQIIKDKTGRLKSYHLTTGKVESEGEIINGKKTGYWRYWDPEGKLTSVGNYKNDLHDGRWLLGDLEGMHYLDDACFDISDPRVMEDMEIKRKQLSIQEIIYLNGKVIKENKFSVNLND